MSCTLRVSLAVGLVGAVVAVFVFMAAGVRPLHAHGTEARYIQEVDWTRPRIAHTYGLSYSELGVGAYRTEIEMRTVEGRQCAMGGIIGFDVEDEYGFDIDESVTLTLTYAPAFTAPFVVVWDQNGGNSMGRTEIQPETEGPLRRISLTLDRARLAGQGTRGIDIAVGSREGLCLCDVEVVRSGTTDAPTAFGRLRLDVTDAASGQPMPVRVGLFDRTGRMPLPSDDATLVHRFTDEVRRLWVSPRAFWPSDHRQAFYINGRYEARIPAGT